MSEAPEPVRDNNALLQATAALVQASTKDDRLAPLAAEAIKLATETDALQLLLATYMNAQQLPSTQHLTPMQRQNELNAKVTELLKRLSNG